MTAQLLNLGTTGMLAQQQSLAVIGNNIANSSTTAYKSGNVQFIEAFNIQLGNAANNGILNQNGQGVYATGTTYDWNAGAISTTGIGTNLALVGDGFFPVSYQGATMYTRAGDFQFSESPTSAGDYVLTRPNGATLMGYDGTSLSEITFDEIPSYFEVQSDGTIIALESDNTTAVTVTPAGISVAVQQFANPDAFTHVDGGLYKTNSNTVASTTTPDTPGTGGAGYIQQGSLENSNVDLVVEFTRMISSQRAFQANSKTVTTADSLMQEILNLKR